MIKEEKNKMKMMMMVVIFSFSIFLLFRAGGPHAAAAPTDYPSVLL